MTVRTVQDYLEFLAQKGFQFGEESIGFITFGQHYTDSSDELVNIAIEVTLKAQKEFDGSFFISLLEMYSENQVSHRNEAIQLAKVRNLL